MTQVRGNFYGHEGLTAPTGMFPAELALVEEPDGFPAYPGDAPSVTWTVTQLEAYAAVTGFEYEPGALKPAKVAKALEVFTAAAYTGEEDISTVDDFSVVELDIPQED